MLYRRAPPPQGEGPAPRIGTQSAESQPGTPTDSVLYPQGYLPRLDDMKDSKGKIIIDKSAQISARVKQVRDDAKHTEPLYPEPITQLISLDQDFQRMAVLSGDTIFFAMTQEFLYVGRFDEDEGFSPNEEAEDEKVRNYERAIGGILFPPDRLPPNDQVQRPYGPSLRDIVPGTNVMRMKGAAFRIVTVGANGIAEYSDTVGKIQDATIYNIRGHPMGDPFVYNPPATKDVKDRVWVTVEFCEKAHQLRILGLDKED